MKTFRNFIPSTKRNNLRLFISLSIVALFVTASLLLWQTAAQMQDNTGENPSAEQFTKDVVLVPTLGNYPNTTVTLGANRTITPDAAPTGATSINVSTISKAYLPPIRQRA